MPVSSPRDKHMWVHVSRRPTQVLIDGEEHPFEYDAERQCATFMEYYPDGPRAKPVAHFKAAWDTTWAGSRCTGSRRG